MILSKPQVSLFWRLWAAACSAQGWQGTERDTERREMLRRCGFESLTQVDQGPGFDRVRAELLRLGHRMEGGMESAYPAMGDMRRHLHVIENRLVPALRDLGIEPESYVSRITEDRGWGRHWRGLADDADRGPERIRQLMMTLTRAVRQRQKEAGVAVARPRRSTKPVTTPTHAHSHAHE